MRRPSVLAPALALLVAACSNAGEDRLLSVSGAGTVKGVVYFDLDGNSAPSLGDDSVKGLRISLLSRASNDTVASAVTDVHGVFILTSVPVGTYRVAADPTLLGDTAVVGKIDSLEVTVLPDDSTFFNVGTTFPHVTALAARSSVTLGRKVFIDGVVLNVPGLFRDTTMHLQDASAAIRTTRVHASAAQLADSVRVFGTTSTRDGQRTLFDVTVFVIHAAFLPVATTVSTVQAANAAGGSRDAQQLQVVNATITDTATVGGDFRLTVNDGSGALDVLLDGVSFAPAVVPGLLVVPGNTFDIVGLAVPTGATGVWRLKPRSPTDLIKR